MPDRVRVLFVDRDPPSGFMATDRKCLEAQASVTRVVYPGLPTPRFIYSCIRETLRNDVVYAFFASEHALVPAVVARILRRRFVLVPGGYDYANVPERNYGLAARGRGWLPRLIGRLATIALPVSRQAMWEFLALVPSAAPRTFQVYLGIDPSKFGDPGVAREPATVVTVANVDEESWSRKGVDRFIEAARNDPTRRYVLVGSVADELRSRVDLLAPPNLECTGRLSHDDPTLRRTLWGAAVYVQFSWHETFGVAVAEAMLCGCVPVITECPALQEVAGPWAVRVAPGEDDVAAIDRACAIAVTVDRAAMYRDVTERFSVAARAKHLGAALEMDASAMSVGVA